MLQADFSELDVIEGSDLPPAPSNTSEAWHDITAGLSRSWLWGAMAMQDIRLRYRGSIIGPFWLTLSTVIMIGSMGVIYARLFKMDIHTYLPFLSVGLIVWQFVSAMIIEGCQTFVSVQNIILQAPMPFSIHAYRLILRNFIVLGHNLVIIPVVLAIFHISLTWKIFWVLPALALLAILGVWISLLFGMISARFRDVPPIVASFVQVLFFVTPIFWSADALGRWKTLAELNPLFAAIDIVRAPLLGVAASPSSWAVMLGMTIIVGIGTFIFFARFRSRIAFWI